MRRNGRNGQGIASEFGGSDPRADSEDRNKLWEARHNVHYAIKSMRPDCEVMSTDICVPISRLVKAILEARDLIESGLTAGIVGHVGDGNFHVGYCINPKNAEVAAAIGHNERMVFRALEMDGTCSGTMASARQIRYMQTEHGLALNAMQAIKQALDPLNIMNPGKVPRRIGSCLYRTQHSAYTSRKGQRGIKGFYTPDTPRNRSEKTDKYCTQGLLAACSPPADPYQSSPSPFSHSCHGFPAIQQ